MSNDDMDEIIQEFLVESAENLDQLDRDLVALEREPSSRELLGSIFRAIHTIKGTTGFLGFSRLEELAHVAENLLSKLRDGHFSLDEARTTALLHAVDAIRGLLALIESTGSDEDDRDLSELIARLTALQTPGSAAPAPPKAASPTQPAASPEPAPAPVADEPVAVEPVADEPVAVEPEAPQIEATPEPADVETVAPVAESITTDVSAEPAVSAESAEETGGGSAAAPVAPPAAPAAPLAAVAPAPGSAGSGDDSPATNAPRSESALSAADRTIRVDVDLLDVLMRQVGELVLARNQVVSHAGKIGDADLGRTVQRLSLIVSELQEGLMKTRMQPVDHLWSKVPRVVRDLASQFGKQINVKLEGGETELDRSIMEAVKDPLTHLVRNAADHGIESPEVREGKGKSPIGSLTLRAFHEGGHVILEMVDDGAGVDPGKVGLRALERGIVSADELDRMSEREVADLIFRPGFSTAEVVTNVSGRGVGMDVVRTNIEKIGGTVDLQSVPGSGTTVRIKVPLTLAIIPALLVGCREARYAIPQAAVQELVRLEGETIRTGIERIDDAMVYRLRGRLLPLVRLDTSLGHDLESLEDRPSVDIVVVRTDGDAIGLVVDDVHETQEIVVKPLNSQLKAIPIFAGATILGDGGVALILDVTGLAQAARVSDTHAGIVSSQHLTGSAQSGVESLLILRVGENRRVAVPLAQVVRLEEIEASRVEHAGSRQVIQYRNDLLPLVWLSDLVGVAPGSSDSTGLHVVVSSDGKRTVGFVAEEILDVVEEVVSLKPIGRSSGLCGTVVVQGMAADLLDIPTALERSGVSLLSDDELRDAMEEMNADVY